MPVRTKQNVDDESRHFSAQDVRGGEIILRTCSRRLIFIAGLIGYVILALILSFAH
jgi:hypothetical protein